MAQPILLVSGGAESVSVAIAEWAIASTREVIVYALVSDSLLEGVPGIGRLMYAPLSSREDVLEDLAECVRRLRDSAKLPVLAFPSEDDSLGLLLDLCARFGDEVIVCSRCRALPGGGLDKALLFAFLRSAGLGGVIADTVTITSETEVQLAREALGEDVIIKPASKPWGKTLETGAKIHSGDELSSAAGARERQRDFARGRAWVAQRRLNTLNGGERSACVVRDSHGAVRYVEVVERVKYPARGGSACIVETQPGERGLRDATLAILGAVDAVGIVELSFLSDGMGMPRLLELNVRPWLQIDLLQSAGFDLFSDAECALTGGGIAAMDVDVRRRNWVSLERLLLKLASGDGGSRWRTLRSMLSALARRPQISIWATGLPGVRKRWARRILGRVVR